MTGTLVETIRYYEREGLLAALRHVLKELPHFTTRATLSVCRSSAIAGIAGHGLGRVRILLRFRDAPAENTMET